MSSSETGSYRVGYWCRWNQYFKRIVIGIQSPYRRGKGQKVEKRRGEGTLPVVVLERGIWRDARFTGLEA